MAYIINLTTRSDNRGNLTVIEKEIVPFEIKRIFYIYGVDNSTRGGHRHKTTLQAAICLHGSCIVSNNDGIAKEDFLLDHPNKCLILETRDWHTMHHFSPDAVLLVMASTHFDPADYIYEPYN
ncbi:MAG: WxcM-like domain-containing protein [Chitinophagaceae bacterium]|jgi:dTDP-4-dehydrorhamnose 3,5-epimerase-like enzyme|nr:MAG: WxcM-like domain-containing protein [Chitinophagaceae bacterium]